MVHKGGLVGEGVGARAAEAPRVPQPLVLEVGEALQDELLLQGGGHLLGRGARSAHQDVATGSVMGGVKGGVWQRAVG